MPSKKTLDYDSYDDDDDDVLDEFKGLKIKANVDKHTFDLGNGTRSHFKPPQKLYTFDYITGPWLKQLVFAGIGDRRVKSFLSEEALVNGSVNGGVATRWSQCQELWEGTIEATGSRQLFFSSDSIDELCNMLAEQVDQVPKSNTKPNKDMSFSAARILEPKSLKPFRPIDVDQLRQVLLSMKSKLFSLILTQSRKAYVDVRTRGGSVFTLKTQRYELDAQIVIEVGWSYSRTANATPGAMEEEAIIKHRVVEENRMYRNGTKIPDQQEFFGFPDPKTREGTKLIKEDNIQNEIGGTIDALAAQGPVLLVLHGADAEIAYFREFLSPSIDKWKAEVPANLYVKDRDGKYPIVIQDTQRLYAAYVEQPEHASTVLHTACTNEGIPCHKVLNAGNASYYLLHLYDRIMSSPAGYQR
ncbi:hypothetical protein P389DRAFT_209273 [Cystobasidium minutum MCA 4210]|uniref:uncharacterized protein n=1 Tax=Cystobasidium minutum MCA 4210 TaxID=1397322 RepID=UPI0034CEE03D|eukprot:jgi/Rhomi1/209273/estExt_Genemark1.C_2_t30111